MVLQPGPSSDMRYPVFTQTIPAPGGQTGISGFKIIFEVRNDDVFEGPETFWVKVDSVHCATSRMVEGAQTVMRAVIVDDDNELNARSSKPAPGHFSWEPAPFKLWADLEDPPTRLISETGADASIPTVFGVPGECFPWRLVLPDATPVDATLTVSVVSLPGDEPADDFDFHLCYDAGGSRAEAIRVSTNPGVFEIPVSQGSTGLVIQLQAVNRNHLEEAGSLEAVCFEALSLEDASGNALFPVGDPSRIRFIIVEE